jgi:adenylate cyclase
LTKTYGISLIITEETYLALEDPTIVSVRRIDRVLVQGRSQPAALYEVLDADEPNRRAAKQRAMPDFEAAINCYDAHDFSAAITYMERALAIAPSDSVAQMLLERFSRFTEEGHDAMQSGAVRLQKAEI